MTTPRNRYTNDIWNRGKEGAGFRASGIVDEIEGDQIADDAIGSDQIAGDAITSHHMSDDSVTSDALAGGAVSYQKLASDVQAPLPQTPTVGRSERVVHYNTAGDDVVSSTLTAGTNVNIVYDEAAATITISATGGSSVTQEQVDDWVNALVQNHATSLITTTYDDDGGTYTLHASPEILEILRGFSGGGWEALAATDPDIRFTTLTTTALTAGNVAAATYTTSRTSTTTIGVGLTNPTAVVRVPIGAANRLAEFAYVVQENDVPDQRYPLDGSVTSSTEERTATVTELHRDASYVYMQIRFGHIPAATTQRVEIARPFTIQHPIVISYDEISGSIPADSVTPEMLDADSSTQKTAFRTRLGITSTTHMPSDASVVTARPAADVVINEAAAATGGAPLNNSAWSAWTEIMSHTITAADVHQINVILDAAASAATGGGDRIGIQYRLVRTRATVDTTLYEWESYLRNMGSNSGGDVYSPSTQEENSNFEWAASFSANDVVKIEARYVAQTRNATRVVTWSATDNLMQVFRPASGGGGGGQGGATGQAGMETVSLGALTPRTQELIDPTRRLVAGTTLGSLVYAGATYLSDPGDIAQDLPNRAATVVQLGPTTNLPQISAGDSDDEYTRFVTWPGTENEGFSVTSLAGIPEDTNRVIALMFKADDVTSGTILEMPLLPLANGSTGNLIVDLVSGGNVRLRAVRSGATSFDNTRLTTTNGASATTWNYLLMQFRAVTGGMRYRFSLNGVLTTAVANEVGASGNTRVNFGSIGASEPQGEWANIVIVHGNVDVTAAMSAVPGVINRASIYGDSVTLQLNDVADRRRFASSPTDLTSLRDLPVGTQRYSYQLNANGIRKSDIRRLWAEITLNGGQSYQQIYWLSEWIHPTNLANQYNTDGNQCFIQSHQFGLAQGGYGYTQDRGGNLWWVNFQYLNIQNDQVFTHISFTPQVRTHATHPQIRNVEVEYNS